MLEVAESQIRLLDKDGDEAELLEKGNIDNQAVNEKRGFQFQSQILMRSHKLKTHQQHIPRLERMFLRICSKVILRVLMK